MTKVTHTLVTVQDFFELAAIIRRHRDWHRREQYNYALHPIVIAALEVARPKDWHQLVLEWPHQSTERSDEIAYTRDEAKGLADVQTRVGAGKYLARHWPDTPSNVLRDLVAAHVMRVEGCCKFLDATVQEIVRSVQQGPVSCMQWDEDGFESTDGRHPYEVYAPELGWRAAVRLNSNGQIIGRALVHDGTHMRCHDTDKAVFVRSYKCYNDVHGTNEYSHADEKLEAWLATQGVSKRGSWPEGTPLKAITIVDHGPLLPYLDGNNTHVTGSYNGMRYCMADNAEDGYNCNDTDGTGTSVDGDVDDRRTCDCCGDATDDDDLTYIEDEETSVCAYCLGQRFTNTSEHGYVRDEHVARTRCGAFTWDERYNPPDSVYVLDHGRYEGDWVHEYDMVSDIDGEYWHVDDIGTEEGCIVRLCDDSHRDGDYVPVVDAVEIDGDWYHRAADVEHDNIVEVTRGLSEGTFVLFNDGIVVGCGDKDSWGVWAERDVWDVAAPCTVSSAGLQPPARGSYFVYMHNDSEFAGLAVDIVDAVLAPDVGWFMPMDAAAGNIVRIMDDVYALASDLVAA